MSGGIGFLDRERGAKTLARFIQTIQLQKDVSEVHERRNVVWLEFACCLVTPERVVKASVLLIEFCEQVGPTKIRGHEHAGVQVSIVCGSVERVRVIDLCEVAIRLTQRGC